MSFLAQQRKKIFLRETQSNSLENTTFNSSYYQQIARLTGVGGWSFYFKDKKNFIDAEGKKILNLPPDYVPSLRKSLDFYDLEYREFAKDQLRECSEGNSFSADIKMLTYDKIPFWAKLFGEPLYDEQDEVIGIQVVFQYINEEKIKCLQKEKSLAIAESQNSRLFHFAHIISHNLRSHASNLNLSLELLKDASSREEEQELTQSIMEISKSLNATVDHLNEIVSSQQRSHGAFTVISFSEILKKVLSNFQRTIQESGAEIYSDFSEVPEIEYAPQYLENILASLISNAIKYSHPDRTPAIDLFSYAEEGNTYLMVRDNGMGMDLEKHGKELFQMYQTFHKNEDAVGIDLFIVKNQIETLQGSIDVESEVGHGTTFRIKF